ncbi:MAG: biotin--[acetyl-CoA-carboxylase] ligase [Ilumatobacter sp.]
MSIDDGIAGTPVTWDVRTVASTGSTNTDLIREVEAGSAGDRTALRADHQSAGRGRLDRRWDAPPGSNLLVSLLFVRSTDAPAALVQRVGLAAVAAIESLAREDGITVDALGLKWPNDLLLDGRKLAGVLAQRSAQADAVVVGIGLNVGWAPSDAATLRGSLGLEVTPAQLLDRLLTYVDERPDDLAGEYRKRLLTLGHDVRVELPGDRILRGRAVDVEEDGRLVVEADGERHVLDVGDVVHLRT